MAGISNVNGTQNVEAAQTWKSDRQEKIWEQYKKMKLEKAKRKVKKKRLNYNAREISSQILRAGSAVGAAQVLVRAKGKVTCLKQCAVTGDYDPAAVRAALTHASQMVACAQKKVRHMEKEEEMKHRGRTRFAAGRKNQRQQEILRIELRKMKKKHRGEEAAEIRKAELQYIRQKLHEQERESRQQDMVFSDIMTEMAVAEAQAGSVDAGDAGTVEPVCMGVDVIV